MRPVMAAAVVMLDAVRMCAPVPGGSDGTVALSDRLADLLHSLAQKPWERSSDVRFIGVFQGA